MLLKRCEIQGFGKLQEFTYEFSEGYNVICAENGWGKSTFAAFLRAMFYGLPQTGSRTKLEEAERRKYKPWNGGVMGGSLVFEVNNKEYRVERTFGKKEAEDTFRLIDLSTNLESEDFSEELGKELFGLDKEAYSRSTYLPQNKIFDGGMNDSIGKKLGRMAEGEEDGGNFDKAYEALDELRKKYIPDRQKEEKGYVAELVRGLSELEARIASCRRKEESAKPWREKEQNTVLLRREAEQELVRCREALEAAAGYEALAAKKQHYIELCGREEGLRVKKESMQSLFPGQPPRLEELRECSRELADVTELTGELRSYRLTEEECGTLAALEQKLSGAGKEVLLQREAAYQKESERAKRLTAQGNRYAWTGVGCFLLAMVAVVLGLSDVLPGIVFAGLFGAAGLLFSALGVTKKKEGSNAGVQANVFLSELSCLREELQIYERLAEKRENYTGCEQKRKRLAKHCTEVLEKYGMDTEDAAGSIRILENRTRDFMRISEDFEEAVKKREQFEQETSPDTFFGLTEPEISFSELQKREQELLVRIARISEEEKDCRNRAEEFEEEAEERTELEERYEELSGGLEAKKREHFFVTETMKCLKAAKEQFSSRYLRGLTTGFETYLSLLGADDFEKSMDGHYTGVGTDINLNIRMRAYGEEKELGYLSTGLRDLLGLCMRFALVDALFSGEQPFLVLDDPFVNLDKEKLDRAVRFLKEAGKRYQILYLVCHDSRV